MKNKNLKGLMEQEFEEGTRDYAFQRYCRKCQEIADKYTPVVKANPGILDFGPGKKEVDEARKELKQELERIAREEGGESDGA